MPSKVIEVPPNWVGNFRPARSRAAEKTGRQYTARKVMNVQEALSLLQGVHEIGLAGDVSQAEIPALVGVSQLGMIQAEQA